MSAYRRTHLRRAMIAQNAIFVGQAVLVLFLAVGCWVSHAFRAEFMDLLLFCLALDLATRSAISVIDGWAKWKLRDRGEG